LCKSENKIQWTSGEETKGKKLKNKNNNKRKIWRTKEYKGRIKGKKRSEAK
jgi:hypothetical protein